MSLEFRLLGSIEAYADGRPVPLGHVRQRSVLAGLLVDTGLPLTTDQLAQRVWGDHPPRQARATLYGYISRLRQALPGTDEADITRRSGGYVLVLADTVTVDLHEFRRRVAEARDGEEYAPLERALALWHGEALAGLDTPWFNALRDTLDRERYAAQLALDDEWLRRGQHAALLPSLTARSAAAPFDERLASQLMLALHRGGRSAEALAHYQGVRRRLSRELGIGPGPMLRQIQAAVLRQDVEPGPEAQDGRGLPEGRTIARTLRKITASPAQLPPPVAPFTGRRDELMRLDCLLATASPGRMRPTAVVVSGTPGVGKTALAVHWAHRVRHAFPDGQLYMNLRGFDPGGPAVSPAEAVRVFLDALGVPSARIPLGLEARVGMFRSLLADRRVLVVLDNARHADQVRPLLPGAPGSLALITSRDRLMSLAATGGAHLLSVDPLAPGEARDLLTGRLGARRTTAEPGAVDEIAGRCAGLPLALAIVAARAAAQPRLPLAALVEELRQTGSRLDALDGGDPASRVREVFSWSQDALSTDAARLFRLLGLHPGPDIGLPVIAALAGVPPARARTLLAELVQGHLVSEYAPRRYALHDLLRAYATELVGERDGEETRSAATHRMLDHYLHTALAADVLLTPRLDPSPLPPARPGATPTRPADHQEALAWFTAEHPVLLAAVELAAATGFDPHAWQLAATLTTFLDRHGYWEPLAAAQTTALEAARRRGDTAGEADAHRSLGLAQDRLGHSDDARTHYAHALDLFGALGSHPGRARTHQHLSRMSEAQGRHEQALDHARNSLQHYRAADDRAGQAAALNHIGWIRAQLGDHQPALTHCQEALALAEGSSDLNGQAHTWDSLGYIHHHLGRHRRAVDCYLHAVALFRQTGDRRSEAAGLLCLGDAHHAAADPAGARDAWIGALALFEELGHPDAKLPRARLMGHHDRDPADTPQPAHR
ncbi:AfsR/SARP family transcriptional regulator [Streptomyces sp. H39-C1]|uniref:AfsR/SARP family transcriptional regulator n=1 Tax=Streptomyces sp. H39-C1 TaxID=3004355 RepID=UPI0022AFE831|nr:BTAD domain-containing putative transcriptional regulator [Streptomyces sp. H39-C1]MCZ4098569.1 BTAD domain-containing putative transcriptional regulator [Streptomyces sp. H39-C1]